jgi:5-oxoprolinase (ATP-hydrolysing)
LSYFTKFFNDRQLTSILFPHADEQTMTSWQIWIDRGGTFTDIVARRPDGSLTTHKLLSENPEHYDDAAIRGIRDVLGLDAAAPIPEGLIASVKMGTTVATNALLERRGDRTLLVITRGFGDALRIGYQNRPRLFARHIILPEMLYEEVLEVPERITATGEIVTPLDADAARAGLERAFNRGIRAVAIVFMHGYRFADHEDRVARMAGEIGFEQISVSHRVSPLMKLVSRGDTTVVDAYLSPLLRRYVDQVARPLGCSTRLLFMQSGGGLTDARLFQGKDAILSGPAGGVVGMVKTAEEGGFTRLIGFDMGGTSTDVAHYDGEYERSFETLVAGVRMRAPMMHIHTVAAGGGSILSFDGARFRVGPQSAGADPGPACYRRGGPLTITDCNVLLGRIQPEYFPRVFGPGADQPLDTEAVREGFAAMSAMIAKATGRPAGSPETVAQGFLRIAVENMANAIKKISVQRGYDVTRYTLNCYGGAGGQHACPVADALGIRTIFLHPLAGVLSAYGMGLADIRASRERQVECVLDAAAETAVAGICGALAADAHAQVLSQGMDAGRIETRCKAHLRYQGTDTALQIDLGSARGMEAAFTEAHQQRFGFAAAGRGLVVEAVSVEAIGKADTPESPMLPAASAAAPPHANVTMVSNGRRHATPLYLRENLQQGQRIDGPALIIEPTGTVVVDEGWRARITGPGHLILERVGEQRHQAVGTAADPVMLEVFNNLFMSVAEQMGATLANTASSVNIKERLDFSCAIFDSDGDLVANAPHIPVHLGSMGESVRTVIREKGATMRPGDVFMLNNPYNGGSHLPDVTVITPVFADDGSRALFYAGSRGHHADIGGRTPGSSPPDSRSIEEEGVLIDTFLLVRRGLFREEETRALLASGPYPCRNIDQNIADLTAQIAANATGAAALGKIIAASGLDAVQAYMKHVQDNAEESVRKVIDTLRDCSFDYPMDDGRRIRVAIRIDRKKREAVIDFTGTSPQQDGNYNAPTAVCRAAVLYVFRTLVEDDIPLNQGCMKPLRLIIPPGTMLSPVYPAAVISGNTEVSQAVTDALFGALGVLASSQGTMNNFLYGNAAHQNYETICGGTGAGPNHPGADAVHSHMTNTRMTDPEVLEWRFPVRIESFSIRRGSGGRGRFPGGDGVVREIRFLEPMTATILSSHRQTDPYGLAGGLAGKRGENSIRHPDGTIRMLKGNDEALLSAGDVVIIKTPGGGGFGREKEVE